VVALALKQRSDGNVMLGEAITPTDRLARDVTGSSLAGIAAEGQRRLPRLRDVSIIRSWGIPVAHTADNRPLLGSVDEIKNFYVAAGLKSTIVMTPVVGKIMAELIAGGDIDPRLLAFSPSRIFSSGISL
jgi:glycine/D-amino acid oxidase-like deaminating enzyme